MIIPCSIVDSSITSFAISSNAFSRSRKIVVVLLLYPGLSVLIGVTFCKSVATVSVVPKPLLKPSEFWCTGCADQLIRARIIRSITFDSAGSKEIGRYVISFFGIGTIFATFHASGSLPSVKDWLISLSIRYLVGKGRFFIIE